MTTVLGSAAGIFHSLFVSGVLLTAGVPSETFFCVMFAAVHVISAAGFVESVSDLARFINFRPIFLLS